MVPLGAALESSAVTSYEAEVLIVGAGPAGSVLGLELARRGRDVLILERARFPRDKPCGDCVNPGAVAELGRLGLADRLRERLAPRPLRGWRVEAPTGHAFRGIFGSDREGWAIRRRELDAALLDEARGGGVRVRFGSRVTGVLEGDRRVEGLAVRDRTSLGEIRAPFVVGADGIRSVVQRRLGLSRRPPRLRKIALVGHLAHGNGDQRFGELRVRDGRVCGYAPVPGGANITLVVGQHESPAIAGAPSEFLLTALTHFPDVWVRVLELGLETAVMVTGPFDWPVRRPWVPGALLVGDAAGYYDPFTGQGIYQALRSARLAAAAVDEVLDDPSRERAVLRRYARRLRLEFAPKRWLQKAIEAAVSRRSVMSSFADLLAAGEGRAADRLLRATGDLTHPAALLDPTLWLRAALGMKGEIE
jgi:geranylgeranyl reductase family protein